MSDIFFFTDVDLLNKQTAEQAFGPVHGCEETQYRVTSMHTAKDDPNAYAMISGVVQIVETVCNDLVNIVLKPDADSLPIGLKIEFIVYRGIRKDSLFTEDLNHIRFDNDIDLLKEIWEHYVFEKDEDCPPSSVLMGTIFDKQYISDLFEKKNSCCPRVEKGQSIGRFDKHLFGIEIVLFQLFSKTTVDSLFFTENIVTLEGISSVKNKNQILSYMDIIALYGLFYKEGINIKTGFVDGTAFCDIISKKFFNRNRLYLDFRFEEMSLALYKHNVSVRFSYITDNDKISFFEINIESYGWPIGIIDDFCVDEMLTECTLQMGIKCNEIMNNMIIYTTYKNISTSQSYVVFPEDQIWKEFKDEELYAVPIKKHLKIPLYENHAVSLYVKFNIINNGGLLFESGIFLLSKDFLNETNGINPLNTYSYLQPFNIYNIGTDNSEIYNYLIEGIYTGYLVFDKYRVNFYAQRSCSDYLTRSSSLDAIVNTLNSSIKSGKICKTQYENKIILEYSSYKTRTDNYGDFFLISISYNEYKIIKDIIAKENVEIPEVVLEKIYNAEDAPISIKIKDFYAQNVISTNVVVYSTHGIVYSSPLSPHDYEDCPKLSSSMIFLEESALYQSDFINIFSVLEKTRIYNDLSEKIQAINPNIVCNVKIDNLNETDGKTKYNNYNSMDIIINSHSLTVKHDIFIAKTFIHEMLHVYLNLYENMLPHTDLSQQIITYKQQPDTKIDKESRCMGAQHNVMADYFRKEILVLGISEYINQKGYDFSNGITITYDNIFDNNKEETTTIYSYDICEAISWMGLVRPYTNQATKKWREFANTNNQNALRLIAIAILFMGKRIENKKIETTYINRGIFDK